MVYGFMIPTIHWAIVKKITDIILNCVFSFLLTNCKNSYSITEHLILNNIKCKPLCVQGPWVVIVKNKEFWNSNVFATAIKFFLQNIFLLNKFLLQCNVYNPTRMGLEQHRIIRKSGLLDNTYKIVYII